MNEFSPSAMMSEIIISVLGSNLPNEEDLKKYSEEEKLKLYEQQKIIIANFRQRAQQQIDALQNKLNDYGPLIDKTESEETENKPKKATILKRVKKITISQQTSKSEAKVPFSKAKRCSSSFSQGYKVRPQVTIMPSHVIGPQKKSNVRPISSFDNLRPDPVILQIEREIKDIRSRYRQLLSMSSETH